DHKDAPGQPGPNQVLMVPNDGQQGVDQGTGPIYREGAPEGNVESQRSDHRPVVGTVVSGRSVVGHPQYEYDETAQEGQDEQEHQPVGQRDAEKGGAEEDDRGREQTEPGSDTDPVPLDQG